MPRFVTISPTHIPGMKEYAWKKFLTGGYVAIGWMDVDLSDKNIDEVISIIRSNEFDNEQSAIESFTKLLLLEDGDYVAVNNTNHGLFGIGIVTSGYRFKLFKHDIGADDQNMFYSHYREVDWKFTKYLKRKDILSPGETAWQPYGTIGTLLNEVPLYIKRILGESIPTKSSIIEYIVPNFLQSVIKSIHQLKDDPNHLERAHESLVEDFFCAIGYEKHKDIKYRQGRVDISIWNESKSILVVEVKRDWNLSLYNDANAMRQAYNYAHEQGARYIIITNGDYYAIFDRFKGLTYESNVIGEIRLTALEEDDMFIIKQIEKKNLLNPNIEVLFKNIAESFM